MKKINIIALITGIILLASINSFAGSVVTDPDVTGIPSGGGGVSPGDSVTFNNVSVTSLGVNGLASISNTGTFRAADSSVSDPGYGFADSNLGIFSQFGSMSFKVGGAEQWRMSNSFFGSGETTGPSIARGTPSGTTVTFIPNLSSANTGVGSSEGGRFSAIANGVEAMRNYSTHFTEFYPDRAGQVTIWDNGDLTVDGATELAGAVIFSGITSVSTTFTIPANIRLVKGNATGGAFTETLPDVTTLEAGHQIKIVKIDSSPNGITLDGFGSQTINGSLTKILRAQWQVITVEAAGTEWIITQATSIVTEGNMHVHDNTVDTVIYTANTPHYIFGLFSSVIELGFTFSAGFDGAIASFSDYSSTVPGAVLANDASHGLSTNQGITINNSTDYNGAFNVTVVDADNFYFTDTFVGDETANWQKGDCMRVDPGSNGPLNITIAGFGLGTTGGTDSFEWEIFQQTPGSDPIPIENAEVKETFTGSTNPTSFTGIGSLSVGDGDEVCIAMIGLTGTDDFENTHISLIIKN